MILPPLRRPSNPIRPSRPLHPSAAFSTRPSLAAIDLDGQRTGRSNDGYIALLLAHDEVPFERRTRILAGVSQQRNAVREEMDQGKDENGLKRTRSANGWWKTAELWR